MHATINDVVAELERVDIVPGFDVMPGDPFPVQRQQAETQTLHLLTRQPVRADDLNRVSIVFPQGVPWLYGDGAQVQGRVVEFEDAGDDTVRWVVEVSRD